MGSRIVGGKRVSNDSESSSPAKSSGVHLTHTVKEIRRADPTVVSIERTDSSKRNKPVVITREEGVSPALSSSGMSTMQPTETQSMEVMSRSLPGPQWGSIPSSTPVARTPLAPKSVIAGPYDVIDRRNNALNAVGSAKSPPNRSVISAASQGLSIGTKVARGKDVGRSFARGFFFESPGEPIQDQFAGETAYYAGLGLSIASSGRVSQGFKNFMTTSDDVVKGIVTGVSKNKTVQSAARFGGKLVKDTLVTLGIAKTSKEASKLTATPEQRAIMNQAFYPEVIREAHIAAGTPRQEESFNVPIFGGQTSFRSMLAQVTPFAEDKTAFENKAREEFLKRGLQGNDLQNAIDAAMGQKRFTDIGETGSMLYASYAAENTGQIGVKTFFEKFGGSAPAKKTFSSVGKRVFAPIAFAGFQEGFTQEFASEISRSQPFNPKQALIEGGVGAVSAGVLGTTIAGLKAKGSKAGSVVNFAANIMDPYEYPGDLLAGAGRAAKREVFNVPTVVPTITTTISHSTPSKPSESIITFGTTTEMPKRSKSNAFGGFSFSGKTPSTATTPSTVQELVFSQKTSTNTMTPSKQTTFKGFSSKTPTIIPTIVPTETPSNTPTQTPTQTSTKSNIFTQIVSGTPTQTETPIQTQTETPTQGITTTITIPTITPLVRLPPPAPLGLPVGTGQSYGKPMSKKYVKELEIAQRKFSDLMYAPAFGQAPSTSSRLRKKASKKTRRDVFQDMIWY